jgi:hypothetical protein
VADVGGGHKIARESFTEFDAEAFGFDELGFGARVEDAEARVAGMAKHAAVTTVIERELAKFGFVDGGPGSGDAGGLTRMILSPTLNTNTLLLRRNTPSNYKLGYSTTWL